MNTHHPIASLFAGPGDLTKEETQRLTDHLKDCEICRMAGESLQSLEMNLRSEAVVGPSAGFSNRWLMRVEAARKTAHQRQLRLTFASLGVALLLFGGLLLSRMWPLIQSPHLLFMTWIYRLMELYVYLGTITEFTRAIINGTPNFLPFVVWVMSFSMLFTLALLSYMSYRLITVNRGH